MPRSSSLILQAPASTCSHSVLIPDFVRTPYTSWARSCGVSVEWLEVPCAPPLYVKIHDTNQKCMQGYNTMKFLLPFLLVSALKLESAHAGLRVPPPPPSSIPPPPAPPATEWSPAVAIVNDTRIPVLATANLPSDWDRDDRIVAAAEGNYTPQPPPPKEYTFTGEACADRNQCFGSLVCKHVDARRKICKMKGGAGPTCKESGECISVLCTRKDRNGWGFCTKPE